MASKIFEVGDVLPATTQLRISWSGILYDFTFSVDTNNGNFNLVYEDGMIAYVDDIAIYDSDHGTWISPYNNTDHAYVDIDTSTWNESKRTVSFYGGEENPNAKLFWEDLNPPLGYTITFNSNGGTTISDTEEATELPTPLPIPTKSGYKFVAWYYESNFQTRAKAGDTIEANTTLYAKWHNLRTLFTGIANAIRSKDGTSENIRDLDFDDRISALPSPKEEETKTVTLDFSSGNVVVIPTPGKVMTQVMINKDANLIEDNIKSGVTIFGEAGGLVEGKPIEVSTAIAMDNLLVSGNVGKIYKFTGPTDANYINGELYEVVSD